MRTTLPWNLLTGELRKFEICGEGRHEWRARRFRNVYINADGVGLRQREELLGAPPFPALISVADVHVTPSDDTAERRVNVLERFKFLQTPDIGFSRSDVGLFRCEIALRVIDFLLGYAVGLDQFLDNESQ